MAARAPDGSPAATPPASAADEPLTPEALAEAADRAMAFVRHATQPPAWPPARPDVAYVMKVPMAHAASGGREEGVRAFAELLRPFLPKGGIGSANVAYAFPYPHYPLWWAARTARELGLEEDAALLDTQLRQWSGPDATGRTCGFVRNPERVECDLFSSAMVVMHHVAFERFLDARDAAWALMLAISHRWAREQGDINTLPLRWDAESLDWLKPHHCEGDPTCAAPAFYAVDAKDSEQLFFMAAFPAIALYTLAARAPSDVPQEEAVAFCEAAHALVDFLRRAPASAMTATGIGKVAVAAALDGDWKFADAVLAHILSHQGPDGSFFYEDAASSRSGIEGDVERDRHRMAAMTALDQTAELVVWLRMLVSMKKSTTSRRGSDTRTTTS